MKRRVWFGLLTLILTVAFLPEGRGRADASAPATSGGGLEVRHASHMGVGYPRPAVRGPRPIGEREQGYVPKLPPFHPEIFLRGKNPGANVPVPLNMAPITKVLSFEGNGNGNPDFDISSVPPDTEGQVGKTQYVQWVNTVFSVYDKASGAQIGVPFEGNSVFQTGIPGTDCANNNDGDPIAHYDQLHDVWILTQFEVSDGIQGTGPYAQCVAVSQTPDATGAYNVYQFDSTGVNSITPSQGSFDDYPKLSVWPDAYYVSTNSFDGGTGAFVGPSFCALDSAELIAGAASPSEVCFHFTVATQPLFGASGYFAAIPTDLDGAAMSFDTSLPYDTTALPTAGAPDLFWGPDTINNTPTVINYWLFHVDFATPGNSTLNGVSAEPFNALTLTVPPYNFACLDQPRNNCVPQVGGNKAESLTAHMMYRASYRNFGTYESVLLNQTVDETAAIDGKTGVQWYEVRGISTSPFVFQQGDQQPDANYRWMGSIAQDRAGNIALGYSVSSAATHPAIKYAVRVPIDPAGEFETEQTLMSGTGSEFGTGAFKNFSCNGVPCGRWGDYSSMTVDPTDDCTFWYTQEYYQTTGIFNWNTRIASFTLPACRPATFAFSLSNVPVAEGGTATLTVVRQGSTLGSGTVNYSTVDETAKAGTDYTAKSGTLNFAPGIASQMITVATINAGLTTGGNREFGVTLSSPGLTNLPLEGAILGSTSDATVTITEKNQPGSITTQLTAYSVTKTGVSQTLKVNVMRSGGLAPVSVTFATQANNARSVVDYTDVTPVTVNFAQGIDMVTENITIAAASSAPPVIPEDFAILLSNPQGGATISRALTPVTIKEPVSPALPTVQVTGTAGQDSQGLPLLTVLESATQVVVNLTRTNPTDTSVINFVTVPGTAQAGVDFTPVSGQVVFDAPIPSIGVPGDTKRSITIPLLDPGIVTSTQRQFHLVLCSPSTDSVAGCSAGLNPAGATINFPFVNATTKLGVPTGIDVTISPVASIVGGSLQFGSSLFSGSIAQQRANIVVLRSGGTGAGVTVVLNTSNGTALAGTDYTAITNQTITFAEGQTSQTITVPILVTATAGNSFSVNLSSPGGGGKLGTTTIATVNVSN